MATSKKSPPSFIVSGTSSGSGKTTVALGLMAAFTDRGYSVQPFKCGPDFIDPGLHRLITGKISRNLDTWMCGPEWTEQSYRANLQKCDLGIVEGVMGMFDGGISSSGSLSVQLGICNILVLDVRSMAESAAAIVKGFEIIDDAAAPAGVILNRIGSTRHLQLVTEAIKKHCRARILGHLPRSLEFSIPSRHLGLLTAEDSPISPEARRLLSDTVQKYIDLEAILELCGHQEKNIEAPAPTPPRHQKKSGHCRIGVARDQAFCFYYEDNFDLLQRAGAELVFFSPMHDDSLPERIDAVYLGGGYPELYAETLHRNQSMICSLQQWIEENGVVYAECGGFMYLTEGIKDTDGFYHPMVGAFPVKAKMNSSRTSLGYREVSTTADSFFGPTGTRLRGHEFHYSKIDPMPANIQKIYQMNNGTTEGYRFKNILGGYMHLHFGFHPKMVENFINFCCQKESRQP